MGIKYYSIAFFALLNLFQLTYLIAGDDPCGASMLNTNDNVFENFNNGGNSNSSIDPPPYGGYAGPDTWLKFIMPSTGIVNLIISGEGMSDPAIAIYEGPCSNPKLLYNILDNNCKADPSPTAILDMLQSGTEYFIRVWAQDGSANGDFNIYLSETLNPNPQFLLHSNASSLGDCIQLTAESNSQQGCAWFEIPIDFSQPFTHTMTANFGDKDGAGADGICLIYQTNGPDYCGGSGGGIGAEGMPNSAIFEFDTWQNFSKNDPVDDHTAFNINGNMNHNSSINGPASLGNIEDGMDHTITFVWDGSSNYELYFDGLLVLSGSYDFINNIFGGNNTAWWGYTSSTGAANNQHVICPNFEDILLGTQEYQEIEICEGESYNGYNTSGFYVDFTGGVGTCLHQINTKVVVHEIPDVVYIDTTICKGEFIYIDGFIFDEEDEYSININSFHGCDSIIIINLKVIESDLTINVDDDLNCINDSITISAEFQSNYTPTNLEFFWDGPQGTYNSDSWKIAAEGVYNIEVNFEYNDRTCTELDQITVYEDKDHPVIPPINDITLSCDEENNPTHFDITSVIPSSDIDINWILNQDIIGTGLIQGIVSDGTYFISVQSTNNGCISFDSVNVFYDDNRPNVQISGEVLNCEIDSFIFDVTVDQDSLTFNWFLDSVYFSDQKQPIISTPGTYQLKVENEEGCLTTVASVITIDQTKPLIDLADAIIPCDSNSIKLETLYDSSFLYNWSGPQFFIGDSSSVIIEEEGFYNIAVTNPSNFCVSFDTVFVKKNGDSPEVIISNDTLNCLIKGFEIEVNSNQDNLTYQWSNNSTIISTEESPYITIPGKYYLACTNENGCTYADSIDVLIDTIQPAITILEPDTLDCDQLLVTISSDATNADNFIWITVTQDTIVGENLETNLPGQYNLIATNTMNGCASVDSIDVYSLINVPEFELFSDTINCEFQTIGIPFEITSTFETVHWISPTGDTIFDLQPLIDVAGSYQLHIEVEGNCDIDTFVYIYDDFEIPEAELYGNDITCDSIASQLSVNFLTEIKNWNWTSPNQQLIYDQKFTSTLPGLYSIEITGANGCTKKDSILIYEFTDLPEAIVDKSDTLTCTNKEVELTAESPNTDITYEWQYLDGSIISDKNIKVSKPGNYHLTIENEYGCKQEYVASVIALQDTTAITITGQDIDCYDSISYIKTNISFVENLDITWSGPNDFTFNEGEFQTTQPGVYTIHVINENGCSSESSFEVFDNFIYPTITLNSSDTLILDRNNITENWDIDYDSETDLLYQWTPEIGLACYDCPYPEILEDFVQDYSLVVTNDYGCEEGIKLHIREKEKPIRITIPNIISVNNDGINDGFTFYGPQDKIDNIKSLLIYDRWGNQVYKGNSLPINEPRFGWQGKLDGRTAVQGVYIFYGEVLLKNGSIQSYSGDVTIIH